jgi:RsiW-degrading membrane proteinase PrsW (M82 family)
VSEAGGFGYGRSVGPGQPGAPQPLPPIPAGLLDGAGRHRGVVFTVLLSIGMVVGAGVMGLVLLASGAPGALAVGVVLAALPVGPVVAAYLWLDRYEPEPRGLLVLAFGWGALIASAVALVLEALDQFALGTSDSWSAALVAPVTEEAAKGLFVLLLLWVRRNELDGILDGIVYAGLVGAGFAFTENIMYLAGAYMGGHDLGAGGIGSATTLFVIRGVFSPFAHPLFTSAIGVGVGVAVVTRSRFWRFAAPLLGYLVAVTAHALWNASAFFGGGETFVLTYLFLMVPVFLLVVGLAVWARRREGQMLTRSLGDCARRGFIGQAEVPWLVRLPARRASRRWARAQGGPLAARAMQEYQQQAIELGFLHDRYLRGTAPADFAARGSVMVQRLAALRPYVLFPRAAPSAPLPGGHVAGPGEGRR